MSARAAGSITGAAAASTRAALAGAVVVGLVLAAVVVVDATGVVDVVDAAALVGTSFGTAMVAGGCVVVGCVVVGCVVVDASVGDCTVLSEGAAWAKRPGTTIVATEPTITSRAIITLNRAHIGVVRSASFITFPPSGASACGARLQ